MENENGVSRRGLFQILGAAPALAAVALPETAAAAEATQPYKRQVFDENQWHTVQVLCDLIIPADDRSPAASAAGVPAFIDDWLAFRTVEDGSDRLKTEIIGGLMWLDRESQTLFQKQFASAAPEQQKQILDRISFPGKVSQQDSAPAAFFSEFRRLTVSGFFSSKIGVADLPYLGNTAVLHWKGCDPKVWAVIEERMNNGYQGLVNPQKA